MNLRNLFSPKAAAPVPSATEQPMCAAGHALDPHWGGVCPYCESIRRGREKTASATAVDLDATVIERETRVSGPLAPSPVPSGRETRIAPMPPSPPGRETRIAPVPTPTPQAASDASTEPRRITALLVSFSGRSTGRVSPLREGRNTIGRSGSGDGQRCDVEVVDDAAVAGEHALVLSRAGRHEMLDLGSRAGTLLDGEPIGSQVVELADHCMIRIGTTEFEFLRVACVPDIGEAPLPAPHAPQAPGSIMNDDEDPDRTRIG